MGANLSRGAAGTYRPSMREPFRRSRIPMGVACMFRSHPEITEQSKRRFSVIVSRLALHVRQMADALGPFWEVRKYRPERYYMRGPGPKWREKHSSRHA